ncbi:MAG: hypothetical protein HGA45_23515, partial [Chloroflexales bacterium]|nr:hypothetical protein [Chloroflexales bacterium]
LQFAGGELEAAAESLAADRAADGELPPGPFVLDERAWLHGMLFLPEMIFTPQHFRMILRHELIHIQRRDILSKAAAAGVM